jgi:hypothetical protein
MMEIRARSHPVLSWFLKNSLEGEYNFQCRW